MAVVRFSEVEAGYVSWLWDGRIPFGAITLIDGDAGVRKSTLSLNIGAAVSAGRLLPGNSKAVVGGVLLLGEEDGLSDTVLPRLSAMDANLERVHTFSGESLTLADDLLRIEEVIEQTESVLVIIDPLTQFLGAGNQEQRVRQILTRVRRMAEKRMVAVLAIRHLAKDRQAAQLAGLGSVAIGAVARSGLLLAKDPSDGEAVVLAQYKCNLAPIAPSLQLRFDGVRLESAEESRLLANDLARPTVYDEKTALGEAIAFLRATLSEGAVHTVRVRKLASDAGVKYRTLRKAKDALGVEATKSGEAFCAPWLWRLPEDDRLAPGSRAEDAPHSEGHLLELLRPTEAAEPDDDQHDRGAPGRGKRKQPKARSGRVETEPEVERELAALTGLASVKQSVLELRGLLAVSRQRKLANLPTPTVSFHAIFAGNPGTGKTTVARIYARLLKQYGRVSRGHVVEVDRSRLIGQHMGDTAVITRKALESALGGVLFIDEAYALKQRDDDCYGQECIDTILKFIEDRRDDMVAILAGYPNEMDTLLATNPGFRSRFTQRLVFADYSDEELLVIFRERLRTLQYRVDSSTENVILAKLAFERESGSFGNARSVRNIIELAIRRQAARLNASSPASRPLSPDDLVVLLPEDFDDNVGGALGKR